MLDMNEKITISNEVDTKDDTGGYVVSYVDKISVFANIELNKSSNKDDNAAKDLDTKTYIVTFREIPDYIHINYKDIIKWRNNKLTVLNVDFDYKSAVYSCICTINK